MKRLTVLLVAGVMSLSIVACNSSETTTDSVSAASTVEAAEAASTAEAVAEASAELANPWTSITEEEASEIIPNSFSAPEGATNVEWSVNTSGDSPLVQLTFDLDDLSFTAREQVTGDEKPDISGMYYEWDAEEDINLANWGYGLMTGKTYRHVGTDEYADLCTWYDVEVGISYSLSVVADDLDGFDIQAVAESMYDESKQASAMIPDDEEDHVPYDITGCDTFTDIVDSLPEGYGYANTTIDDIDVLLVCDYVFDNSDDASGVYAAIDADVYYYSEDGVPTYAGYVTAGGTAYPLAVADGKLYVCGNHFAKIMTIVAGGVVIDEESYVEYNTDGSATYYHHSDLRDVEADEEGRVEDDSYMTEIYDQYMNAEVIVFDQVG